MKDSTRLAVLMVILLGLMFCIGSISTIASSGKSNNIELSIISPS